MLLPSRAVPGPRIPQARVRGVVDAAKEYDCVIQRRHRRMAAATWAGDVLPCPSRAIPGPSVVQVVVVVVETAEEHDDVPRPCHRGPGACTRASRAA